MNSRAVWARRLGTLAMLLSIGGVVAALVGAIGSGHGAWHFRVGFTFLQCGLFAAIGGGVLAIAALAVGRGARAGTGWRNLVALAVSLLFLTYLGSHILTARSVPAIHDITTNLDDVPQFTTLRVRGDNLENVPDEGDPRLKAMDAESRWKTLHRRAYGDLRTVRVPWSVSETIRRAEVLARARGWEIARVDPEAGILEATDTTFFFRFKDDVVLRARPDAKGGSEADIRSISRVGVSDVGVNAKRIRAFLADLQSA